MASQLPDELKVAKEATVTAGGGATGGGLRYLVNILIARFLGVEMLGIYALSNAITQIAQRAGALGLDIGVIRYVSKLMAVNRRDAVIATVRRAIVIGLGTSLLMMVIILLLADDISARWFQDTVGSMPTLLKWFALAIPITFIAGISSGISQGLKVLKHRVLALQIFPTATMALGLIVFVYLFDPATAIGGAYLLAQIVSVAVALYLVTRLLPIHRSTHTPHEPGMARFSLPLVGAAMITTALNWSDQLLLGVLIDSRAAGLYQPAIRTASMFSVMAYSFSSILSPLVSEHEAKDNKAQISHLLKLTTRWSFTLTWSMYLLVMLYAPKVLLVFGGDFLPMTNVLKLLVLGQLCVTLTSGVISVMTMTGYPQYALFNSAIALAVNISLNLTLIPKYGIMGAAIASTAAMGLLTVLRLSQIWWLFRIHPFTMRMSRPLVAGGVAWFVGMGLNKFIYAWHTVATLLVGGIIFVLIYALTLILLGLEQDDRSVLAAFGRKLKRRLPE